MNNEELNTALWRGKCRISSERSQLKPHHFMC